MPVGWLVIRPGYWYPVNVWVPLMQGTEMPGENAITGAAPAMPPMQGTTTEPGAPYLKRNKGVANDGAPVASFTIS